MLETIELCRFTSYSVFSQVQFVLAAVQVDGTEIQATYENSMKAMENQEVLWDKHDSDTKYLAEMLSNKICELAIRSFKACSRAQCRPSPDCMCTHAQQQPSKQAGRKPACLRRLTSSSPCLSRRAEE